MSMSSLCSSFYWFRLGALGSGKKRNGTLKGGGALHTLSYHENYAFFENQLKTIRGLRAQMGKIDMTIKLIWCGIFGYDQVQNPLKKM